jgi:hypothetical protein
MTTYTVYDPQSETTIDSDWEPQRNNEEIENIFSHLSHTLT